MLPFPSIRTEPGAIRRRSLPKEESLVAFSGVAVESLLIMEGILAADAFSGVVLVKESRVETLLLAARMLRSDPGARRSFSARND